MKRIFFFIVFVFTYTIGESQCVNCSGGSVNSIHFATRMGQNNNADGASSIAGGFGSKSIGDYSIGLGYRAIANAQSSFAIGVDVYSGASNSFAIGNYVEVNASKSFVIGRGYDDTHRLINGTPSSMMIGFMSTAPTLFISSSNGTLTNMNLTGQVGIGNVTKFAAKLHIKSDEGELADIFLQSTDWDEARKSTSSIYIGTGGHSVTANAALGLIFNSEKNYHFGAGNVGFGLDIAGGETPKARLHVKAEKEGIASVFIEPTVWDDGTMPGGGEIETGIGLSTLSTKGAYLLLGNELHGIGAKRNTGLIFSTESFYVFNDGFLKLGKDARAGSVLVCTDAFGTAKWFDASEISHWLPSGVSDIFYDKGNVGVGTDDPLSKLEVKGQVSIGYHVNPPLGENNLIVQGKVGIGTFNPSVELEVVGKLKTTQLQILDGHLNGYILQCDNEGNASWINPTELNVGGWLQLANNVYVEPNRYVGIGTSSPTQPLDVVGNVKISGDIFGARTTDWPPFRIFAGTNENDGAYMLMSSNAAQNASIKLFARGTAGCIEFFNANRQIMSVREDNNVYIGDHDNKSDLWVYGEIKAHLVRVTTDIGWFDYVFDKEYALMPLNQLEAFVNEHHHLPDMPTEQQVHEEGLDIAQMNALLLKKVEELTLYIIEQEKRIEQLEKKSDY